MNLEDLKDIGLGIVIAAFIVFGYYIWRGYVVEGHRLESDKYTDIDRFFNVERKAEGGVR